MQSEPTGTRRRRLRQRLAEDAATSTWPWSEDYGWLNAPPSCEKTARGVLAGPGNPYHPIHRLRRNLRHRSTSQDDRMFGPHRATSVPSSHQHRVVGLCYKRRFSLWLLSAVSCTRAHRLREYRRTLSERIWSTIATLIRDGQVLMASSIASGERNTVLSGRLICYGTQKATPITAPMNGKSVNGFPFLCRQPLTEIWLPNICLIYSSETTSIFAGNSYQSCRMICDVTQSSENPENGYNSLPPSVRKYPF
jgi:hypothetical protein